MAGNKKSISLILQIAIIFIVGICLVGTLSSIAVYNTAISYVTEQLTMRAGATAGDLENYLKHFQSHEWLLQYWYEHYDELDIEYEDHFDAGSVTSGKVRSLIGRHPTFLLEYSTAEEVEALPPEDQKLFAEIVYSWLITHIDNIETLYDLDYLFAIVTDEPYNDQFVLFIAATEDEERGDQPGQVYMIGKNIKSTDAAHDAIASAVAGVPDYASNKDGRYYDYYYSVGSFDGHEVLLVLSRDVRWIREDVISEITKVGVLFLAGMLALAAVCLLLIHYTVLRPLKKVQTNIRLYKNTKDASAIIKNLSEIRTHNELADLSNDVADLTKEIDNYTVQIRSIASRRERIKTELALANSIQTSTLPNVFPAFPDRKDFDIYASMEPAREVGGDFYDFFLVDEDHLCLVIADVSGKGIPAALFMMASRISLQEQAKKCISPATILTDVNKSINEHNPQEMFITVWLGILDLKTGVLTAANAGHEYPILKKGGMDFALVRDKHGFVLGGMEETVYSEYRITLDPGSKLFLYTDGLAEANSPDKKMFGVYRILKELNKVKDGSPEEIITHMKHAVDDFVCGTEPFDDLTMMCLTYNGPDQAE